MRPANPWMFTQDGRSLVHIALSLNHQNQGDILEFLLQLGGGQHPHPCNLHPTPYTRHTTPYTRHTTFYTLRPAPYAPHPTPYIPHLTPHPLHPLS